MEHGPALPVQVLVITGPVGAGKSTVMDALSGRLEARAVPHAAVDMDFLRWISPRAADDPFAARLGYRNLAAIWPNLESEGVRCVVIADVVETRAQVGEYERAIPGADVAVIRLDVPMELILSRLDGREGAETVARYRNRAPELQAIMEREGVADLIVDVGHRPPEDVADEILQWLTLLYGQNPTASS